MIICICNISILILNSFKSFANMSLGFYQVARSLDSGNQLYDLSNGVKYGQSTVYDSGQYNEDIEIFKRMVNGSFDDSEFDMNSMEYRSTVSREMSGSRHSRMPYSEGSDSDFRVFHGQRSNTQNMS